MGNQFKPQGYNQVSPYFIVDGAAKFMGLVKKIFGAEITRRYENPDGTIMHAELRIGDSIIMVGDSSEKFPAIKQIVHVYVDDVDRIFKSAIDHGCASIEEPTRKEGDPDKRGTFQDFAGNMWSIGTQQN